MKFILALIFAMISFPFSHANTLISYERLDYPQESPLSIIKPFKVSHNLEMLYEDIEKDQNNFLMARSGLVFRGLSYPNLEKAMESILKKMQQGISFSKTSRPILQYEGEYNLGEHQTTQKKDSPWISTSYTFEWAYLFSGKLEQEVENYAVILLINVRGLPNVSIGDFSELYSEASNMFLREREISIYKNIPASNIVGAILFHYPSPLSKEGFKDSKINEVDKIKVFFNKNTTEEEKMKIQLLVQSKFNKDQKIDISPWANDLSIKNKINFLLENNFDTYDSILAAKSLNEEQLQLLIHLKKNAYITRGEIFDQQLIDLIRDLSTEQLYGFKKLFDTGFHMYPDELYNNVRYPILKHLIPEQLK